MDLAKDLQELLKKHGLKADPAPEGTDPESEEEEEDKPEGEGKPEKPEGEKPEGSEVVANLAEGIAQKIVDEIVAKKGLLTDDKDNLLKDTRSKIFTNWAGLKEIEYPSDLKNLTKEEKIVNFFKALVYPNDPASQTVLRALVEGTDALGGYLVPEELRAEVFRILPDMAVMRRIARTIPMASDTLLLTTLTARPYAYWTSEYASKSTTSAEFGRVTLNPNDLVCLLPVSEQLLADANIQLVTFIIELFAEAIAAEEDDKFFTGSGTGQPKGINQETLTSRDALGTLDFDDIIWLIDAVPQRVSQSPGAAFVGHRYVKRILRGVKDTTNNYIWRDGRGGVGGGGESIKLPDTLYGYPFYEQNDLSQDELYFGDWKFYIIGDRQALSVRTTTEGGDAWRRNSVEIKAVERVDGTCVLTGAFAKITGITL